MFIIAYYIIFIVFLYIFMSFFYIFSWVLINFGYTDILYQNIRSYIRDISISKYRYINDFRYFHLYIYIIFIKITLIYVLFFEFLLIFLLIFIHLYFVSKYPRYFHPYLRSGTAA